MWHVVNGEDGWGNFFIPIHQMLDGIFGPKNACARKSNSRTIEKHGKHIYHHHCNTITEQLKAEPMENFTSEIGRVECNRLVAKLR